MIDVVALMENLVEAEKRTLSSALTKAVKLSAGKYSYRRLERHNYPYGLGDEVRGYPRGFHLPKDKRGVGEGEGVPYGDSAIINRHSGLFAASWNLKEPSLVGQSIKSTLDNSAPYADELADGIPGLTIARPTIDAIAEHIEDLREKNIEEAFR